MIGRALVVVVVAAVTLGAGCSGDDDDGSRPAATTTSIAAGITPDEAIEIAQRAWEAEDPDFDLSATRPTVGEAGGTYDVGFVPVEITELGGEPHVVVDRVTGEVVETYRTR